MLNTGGAVHALARCGEMRRDVECRARMASAAPSIGLRRGHIGFHAFFSNLGKKCKKMHVWKRSIDVR